MDAPDCFDLHPGLAIRLMHNLDRYARLTNDNWPLLLALSSAARTRAGISRPAAKRVRRTHLGDCYLYSRRLDCRADVPRQTDSLLWRLYRPLNNRNALELVDGSKRARHLSSHCDSASWNNLFLISVLPYRALAAHNANNLEANPDLPVTGHADLLTHGKQGTGGTFGPGSSADELAERDKALIDLDPILPG